MYAAMKTPESVLGYFTVRKFTMYCNWKSCFYRKNQGRSLQVGPLWYGRQHAALFDTKSARE